MVFPFIVAGIATPIVRAIAAELTARKVETARGGIWTAVQVSNILKRAAE